MNRRQLGICILTVGTLAAIGGCGAANDTDPAPIDELWVVVDHPAVSMSSWSEPEPGSLYQVRGATRLSDGTIVVVNAGSNELVAFSPDGRRVGSFGREGEGPGEFQRIESLQRGPNDSIFAYDLFLQRLTAFSTDGQVARTASFHVTGEGRTADGLSSVSRLDDGVWIGREHGTTLQGRVHVLVRDTIAIGLLDGDLNGFLPLARLPASISVMTVIGGQRAYGPAAFTPIPVYGSWGRCVFLSSAEDPSISVYTSGGDHVTTFIGPGTPRAVTEEHLDGWVEMKIQRTDEAWRAASRRPLREKTHPDMLPYYSQLVLDQWGHVWLQEYAPPEGYGGRWYVLSQSGQHLSDATLPRSMLVFEITEAGILGVRRNEFDEEIVELFAFEERPSPDSENVLSQCSGA